MQHSKHTGFNLKRKITASLLSLAILGTGTLPLVSTVVAAAAEDDGSVGANAPVIAVGNTDENKDVFWANAKYYDYLTDNEVSGGWLTGLTQSGTGHCGSDDDWYPFKKFNSFISGIASGSNWSKPLYFGNFYNDNDGPYATSDHNGPYTSAKDGLTNFRHSPNNSQKGVVGHDSKKKESGVETTGIDEEHQSYQGLVDSTLKNGNLTVGGGTVAPYFQANDTYVKEFQSSFPFRQEVHSDYTKYIFQSSTGSNNENAADNVYFDWNGTTPTAVNYSYGTNHAVKDGKRYFMWKENSGYGIYPFNKVGEEKSGQTNGYLYISVRNSEVHWDLGMNKDPYVYWNDNRVSWPGTKMEWVRDEDGGDNKVYKIKIPDGLKNTGFVVNNGNGGGSNQTVDGSYDLLKWGCATVKGSGQGEKHNLEGWPTAESGAGINEYTYNTEKLDHGFGIHLTVPFRVPKGGVAADGTKITFDFAGDDDLWMFITDNTTKKSQLVLDMGGNHKKSVGQVDFKNKQSTVNAYNGQKDSAKSFEFDYSHTYTMDVFYMERGMIESNCDMSFTMTPLGNNVIVTEKINTTDINPGLVDDVTAASQFEFVAEDTDGNKETFSLGDDGRSDFPGTFTVGKDVKVTQKKKTDSSLVYDTTFDYTDNTAANPSKGNLGSGEGDSTKDVPTDSKNFLNESGDTYDYVEFQADYVNTPRVADVTLSKETVDFINQRLNSGDLGQSDSFPVTVSLDFGGTNGPLYDFDYTVKNGNDTSEGTANAGKLNIRDGDEITIPNVPVGSTVTVSETLTDNFDKKEISKESFEVTENGGSTAITNYRKPPEGTTDKVTVNKTIFTKTFEDKSTATLGDGYKFELYYGETKLDTITITDPSSDTASDVFKDLKFSVDEADKNKEAQGIFYIAPETFKNGGSKEFTFTVKEVLTDDQKKAIDQPADQTATIIIYYDKANNKLTNIPPDQVGSVPNPDHTTDFVNPYNVGSVSITKTVTRDSGELDDQDKNTAFTINVSFSFNGKTYPNGVPFYYTVNGGSKTYQLGSSQSISLKHGETASFDGLPVGTAVTVSEANPGAEYSPSVSPESVKITEKGQAFNVVVTNKRQAPGATSFPVKFTKQFKYGTLEGNDFEFKITDGDPITGKTAKNDKNGVADFGTVDVKYVKTAKPAEGTTVYLTDDDFDATGVATLTFTAKETDAHEANVFYDQESVTFVQKIKKTVTAAQTTLSLDNSYYEKGNASNLTEGKFVNEYKGDIKISKTIENVSEAQKEKTFTADVEIKLVGADGKLSDKFEKIPYSYTYTDEGSARPVTTDPTTELELKHGRVFTLSGIPMGSVIKVTERADAKYTPRYNTTEAKVGETAEIIVTNTLNTPGEAKLDVYKTFSENALTAGVNMESKNNKFSFTMTGDSENAVLKDYSSTVVLSSYEDGLLVGKGTFDKITFPSNYAYGSGTEVKFHVVENAQIEGNDGNIIYDKSEYDVVYTVSLGEEGIRISAPVITKGNAPAATVTFQNDYPVGKVQILKSVKDFDGTDLEAFKAGFPIKITITTPDGNETEDTTKTISAADSLDPEKVLTIDKLPYGTTVKVEETDAKGMTSSVDKPEVTVDENTPAQTVTVTNTRTKLTPAKAAPYVNKTVKGSDISLYNEKFDFELSGNGITPLTAKNNAQGKVQFGDINFRLKKAASDKTEGNTIVIDRSAFANSKTIPFTFTVKETTADTDDIKTDKTEKTVTIKVTLDDSAIDEVKLTAAFDDTAVPTFTNEKYGRVKVTKKVLDINNTELKPDVNFGFELYNGNTKVDSFTINVSKTDTESYTSAYFPVDTVLTVMETNPNGFNCTKDVQTITVLDEAQNEIPVVNFDNKRPQPGEVSKEFSVNKVAQGYKLSSGDFSFTAKGPNGFDETVANDVNGSANFSKITFKYTTGEEQNTATTIYLRDKDFKDGPAKFKYTITENDGGNNDIIYDLNTVVEAVITVEMNKVSESEIDLVASLAYTGGNNTFTNPVRTGSAKIIKKDQEDNPVDGVEFTLYKVSSDNLSRQQVLEDGVVQGRATTSGGEAVFENLDLYVDGNQTLGDPEYQWYCFAETDPGDSHNLNSELKFFRIPTEGVYDVEYTYMNGKITSPISGGEGMFTFKLVGSILLALASAMLAGYVFFVKKSNKKSARFSVKK